MDNLQKWRENLNPNSPNKRKQTLQLSYKTLMESNSDMES